MDIVNGKMAYVGVKLSLQMVILALQR